MSNSFLNIQDITRLAAEVTAEEAMLARYVNRGYDDKFKDTGLRGKIGGTANIRLPYRGGAVTSGKVLNPDSFDELQKAVTVSQYNMGLQFSSKDLTLNINDFKDQCMRPQVLNFVAEVERQGMALIDTLSIMAGTPGTAPTTLKDFAKVVAIMGMEANVDKSNIMGLIHPLTQVELVDGLKLVPNDIKELSRQYKEGSMGQAAGIKFSSSNLMPTHVTGVATTSTALTEGAVQEGSTTIDTDGWASGASSLKAGDVISFDGIYSVDPHTYHSTGVLKQFVVTVDISDTSGDMDIAISPAIYASGHNKNVTALPGNDCAIYVNGVKISSAAITSKSSPLSLVFHRDAMILAAVDLEMPKGVIGSRYQDPLLTNFPFRVIETYDGRNDDHIYRLDACFGWTLFREGFAGKIMG